MDEIRHLQDQIEKFSEEREWSQFHTGKDLSMALQIEASELLEAFLWKGEDEVNLGKVREELADVINYALLIASKYNLDVKEIVEEKLKINARKYPVDKAKGTAKKYDEL
ncbi:MAG: nucleotide pyrophosphohydrolase [Bacteroidaceae bacterium]|nr:nucleotide pyrophosphohydrolase [Bacteroidaceae bacterium]